MEIKKYLILTWLIATTLLPFFMNATHIKNNTQRTAEIVFVDSRVTLKPSEDAQSLNKLIKVTVHGPQIDINIIPHKDGTGHWEIAEYSENVYSLEKK